MPFVSLSTNESENVKIQVVARDALDSVEPDASPLLDALLDVLLGFDVITCKPYVIHFHNDVIPFRVEVISCCL